MSLRYKITVCSPYLLHFVESAEEAEYPEINMMGLAV